MPVEVHRGSSRFVTRGQGRRTQHSFSFGEHYDPENVGFGPLTCHDDHLLRPGLGFEDHSHRDVEIVTWVLTGAVRHTDASGRREVVPAGSVAVQSAGFGVVHAEIADPDAGPTRFVQAWLRPDLAGGDPSYAVAGTVVEPGSLVAVASGSSDGPGLRLAVAGATFSVALLDAGETLTLPDAPRQHVFVARGALARSSLAEPLSAGDAFRISDHPGLVLAAASPTELLVWTFGA